MKKKTKRIILWTVIIFLVVNLGVFTAIPFMVMNPMVDMHVDYEKTWDAKDYGIEAKHFFVETEDGMNISTYEIAVDTPKVVIICLSGIHNPSATAYFGHARMFKEHDYATILFDMRAHGESDGDKICLGYKEYLDTKAIVGYIKANPQYDNVPIVVMGLSMGAASAINSIGEIPEIDGLISLSAYSSWEDVFYENMAKEVPKVIANIERPFVSFTSYVKYGSSSSVKPKKEIQKLNGRPVLLMHSKGDSQVSYYNFERLMKVAPPQVETFVREGDLHFMTGHFTEPEKDEEYSKRLLEFIGKYFF